MKPAWDKLMAEFDGHKTITVGDVDCTAEGKPICDNAGVKGYPTIKQGDPANLEDYSGGRDFDSLQKFAAALKPVCSPAKMDECDDESKAKIEAIIAKDNSEIEEFIAVGDKKVKDSEELFDAKLEELQATYKGLQDAKEATATEVKDSGIGMYKAVLAHKKKTAEMAEGSPDAKAEL